MSEQRARIHRLLNALVRRERWLLLLRALLQLTGAALLAGLLALFLVLWRLPQGLAQGLFWALLVSISLAALVWPAGLRLSAAGDRLRQARLVERARPALRGRLLTVAERRGGPRQGESAALLDRAVRRTAQAVSGLRPVEIHSARPLGRLLALVSMVGLASLLAGVLGPLTPRQALAQLLLGAPLASAELRAQQADERDALIGDIVLRYAYPAYTGLEPLVVPNSTGDVHAPPGTLVEIRARSAARYDSAALALELQEGGTPSPSSSAQADGESSGEPQLMPATLQDGRDLLASFEVSQPGSWRFLLVRGTASASEPSSGQDRSRAHAVEIDQDLAPEVLLEAPEGVVEVAWDKPIPANWTARDDYGVQRVEALAESAAEGGEGAPKLLRQPLDATLRLSESLAVSPADLGLLPGSEGWVRVLAWDNDAISGSKAGVSRPLRVRVLGPQGEAARRRRMVRQLRDVLLSALADSLEEPWPPRGERAELVAWGAQVNQRMEPLEALVEAMWQGFDGEGFEGTVVAAVRQAQASLVGFVQALGQGQPSKAVDSRDLATLLELRDDFVAQLEMGILTLDQVVRAMAMERLDELVAQLAEEAENLRQHRDDEAGELLSRMDRLERLLQRLSLAALELGEGNLSEFVNSRARDGSNLVEELRRAIAEGRMDDARALADRLARELSEFAEQVQQMKLQRQREDAEKAMQAEILLRELQAMEQEQRALAGRTAQLRQEHGGEGEQLTSKWNELARRAGALADELLALAETMEGEARRPAAEGRLTRQASAEARGLRESIEARDIHRAIEAAERVEWTVGRSDDMVRRHGRFMEDLPRQAVIEASLAEARQEARLLREELEQARHDLSQASPELREAVRQLADQQAQLAQRNEQVQEQARQVARGLPMRAPGLEDGVERAAQDMERAQNSLEQGAALQGEGSQRSAAEGLAEAVRALERAMRDAREMSQCSRCQGGSQDGDKPREDGDKGPQPMTRGQRVEIPAPEEFRTPEAYRKALLEGMQAAVPQEYEALNRRYYEELVRQ